LPLCCGVEFFFAVSPSSHDLLVKKVWKKVFERKKKEKQILFRNKIYWPPISSFFSNEFEK
tara:strand:+ start:799 stop:981 length:183 start_codon:yes stop_codon:yes gene_type:complete